MSRARATALLSAAAFLSCVVAANYVTTHHGLVPVGFGLTATAGTYLAGITFVLRDSVQDGLGRLASIGLVLAGAVVSYLIADPFIALASGVAFLAAEIADLAIYTPLRSRGYVRAAVASNIVGAVVDTLLFLWIAGFALTAAVFAGQIIGKLVVTAAVVALVLAVRGVARCSTSATRAGATS